MSEMQISEYRMNNGKDCFLCDSYEKPNTRKYENMDCVFCGSFFSVVKNKKRRNGGWRCGVCGRYMSSSKQKLP
jgi:transposase-like protein